MFKKWFRTQKKFRKLHITLKKESDALELTTLEFDLEDYPFVQQWAKLLEQRLKEKRPLNPNRQCVGFKGETSRAEYYVERIRLALAIFKEAGILDLGVSEEDLLQNINQEKLNILHHQFDQMRGPVDRPTEAYLQSDARTREQMNIYNESIHALENILIHRAHGKEPIPYIYVEFMNTEKLKLPHEVYEHFSLHRDFGDLFIHYSQVGKSWLEAYEDEDDIMERENIRPHEFYDGSFDICFRAKKHKDTLALQKDLHHYLSKMGENPQEVSHALGRLVVGKFRGVINAPKDLSNEPIDHITSFPLIHKIELF